jgi:hypothetical protein
LPFALSAGIFVKYVPGREITGMAATPQSSVARTPDRYMNPAMQVPGVWIGVLRAAPGHSMRLTASIVGEHHRAER